MSVDTSALHFFDPETGLGIYDQCRRKEQHREKSLGSEGRRLSWRSSASPCSPPRAAGPARRRRTHAVSGSITLRRRLDGRGGQRLRGRDQGVQQGVPGREGQLQAGRRQPPDRALDRRRGRQSAGHGRHRPAGPRQAVRRQGRAEADRLRAQDAARELRAVVDRARRRSTGRSTASSSRRATSRPSGTTPTPSRTPASRRRRPGRSSRRRPTR